MKIKDILITFTFVLVNVVAGLASFGLFAHLAWYVVKFGWEALP